MIKVYRLKSVDRYAFILPTPFFSFVFYQSYLRVGNNYNKIRMRDLD